MERVVIVGSGGAGKSTIARRLHAATGLPLHHLDVLYWRPGWVETPDDEWRRQVADLVAGDRWIIDGNYGGTLDLRMARADTIVFVDLSRWTCTRRAAWRSVRRWGERRPDLAAGCDEKFDLAFLRWVWTFGRLHRPRVVAAIERHQEGRRVVWLRRPHDVAEFLRAPADFVPAVPS